MPENIKKEYIPKTKEQKLGYLIEECGETLHAAGKCLRWGFDGSNPELPEEEKITNGQWLANELRDLKRAISYVESSLDENKSTIKIDDKDEYLAVLEEYIGVSFSMGVSLGIAAFGEDDFASKCMDEIGIAVSKRAPEIQKHMQPVFSIEELQRITKVYKDFSDKYVKSNSLEKISLTANLLKNEENKKFTRKYRQSGLNNLVDPLIQELAMEVFEKEIEEELKDFESFKKTIGEN